MVGGSKPFGPKVEPWPKTFAKVFDRVFGAKHLSLTCISTSILVSFGCYVFSLFVLELVGKHRLSDIPKMLMFAFISLLPDYVSLLKTRWLLGMLKSQASVLVYVMVLVLDVLLGCVIAVFTPILTLVVMVIVVAKTVVPHASAQVTHRASQGIVVLAVLSFVLNLMASFFASVWLWLYAASGFLLKFARRFDIGFQWFNSKVDIEHKPLSAIGLVAGALVSVLWWTVVVVRWIV